MTRHTLVCLLAAAFASANAQSDSTRNPPVAQSAATAPQLSVGPAIRRLSTASAISKEKIGAIMAVRELPDGRVLVNDGISRRLLLLDTMLVTERVVLDSLSEKENTYGTRPGGLIAYRGDSSLFIDPSSLAVLVIDPSGNIVRVRSVPRAQDTYAYGSNTNSMGNPGADARGRLIYRMYAQAAPPAKAPPKGVPWFPQDPDSAFIVALDLETRTLDTIGVIRTPKSEFTVRLTPTGGFNFYSAINPLPSGDEWAVLPDGSVALVRAIDYRVDYRTAAGQWTSSPKIPFDWQPVSDADKEQIVDSVRAAQSKTLRTSFTTSVIRYVNTYGKKYPPNFTAPEGYLPPNGFAKDWQFPTGVKFPDKYIYGCEPGVEPTMTPIAAGPEKDKAAKEKEAVVTSAMPMGALPMGMGMSGPGGAGGTPSCIPQPIPNLAQVPQPPVMREVTVLSAKALPDFRPPFNQNSVRADLDGNLWIRINTPKPIPGGPVFDVVNRSGQLVDRLQPPPGYTIVGFGRGRVVFLTMRDAAGIHLARVRLK